MSILFIHSLSELKCSIYNLLAYLSVDGKDLSKSLIQNKLGRKYNGGKRRSWC